MSAAFEIPTPADLFGNNASKFKAGVAARLKVIVDDLRRQTSGKPAAGGPMRIAVPGLGDGLDGEDMDGAIIGALEEAGWDAVRDGGVYIVTVAK